MIQRILQRLLPFLTSPGWTRRLPLLTLLLGLPALGVGFCLDDHFHRILLQDLPTPVDFSSPRGMFTFVDGDPATRQIHMDYGTYPLWTSPRLLLSFARPLTELTHRLDYALWPDSALAMHLHGLAWAGLITLLAALVYRQVLGRTGVTASLAGLLYAVDDGRGLGMGWIANRNALTTVAFGLACLWAHHRNRTENWKPGWFLTPIFLAASLGAGEGGLATCGWLLACALFLDPSSPWKRAGSLLPAAAVTGLWALGYRALAYGAHGSDAYTDPIQDMGRYLELLPIRYLSLLEASFLPWPSEVVTVLPWRMAPGWVGLALPVLGVLAVALLPRIRSDARARFFAFGLGVGLLPVCSTLPSDRLLGFAGFGVMGLLATFLTPFFDSGYRPPSRWISGVAVGMVAIHLILAPLLLPVRAWAARPIFNVVEDCFSEPLDASIASQDLILVNAPDFCASYVPVMAALRHTPWPLHVRNLAPGIGPASIRRTGPQTLEIRREGGYFQSMVERLFVEHADRWDVGKTVSVPGLKGLVKEATSDGRPVTVEYTFDSPLEEEKWRWMRLQDRKLVPFALPAIGGPEVEVPGLF